MKFEDKDGKRREGIGGNPDYSAAEEWADFSGYYDTAGAPAAQDWTASLPDASGEFTGTFDAMPCSLCGGFGWIGNDWLHQRPPKCSCPAATDDFTSTMHSAACDSVPCPFCESESQ